MNRIPRRAAILLSALAILAQLPSCQVAEQLLSDLELQAVALMAGPGISPSTMRIQQGARANFSVVVHIDNLLTPDQQDTFDRNSLAVRLSLWNTAPDDKDTSDGLEEYHDTITYRPSIGYVPPGSGPLMSINVDDDKATNIVCLAPYLGETLPFPPGLGENPQLLDDYLAFAPDRSRLEDIGLATNARQMRDKHIPRARYVQTQLNNHYWATPLYELVYRDAVEGQPVRATYLIFTFEIATHQLKRGQWELRVEVDPEDVIAEPTNANNASRVIDLELIEPFGDIGGWEPVDPPPEEWYVATCDMVVGQPDDYGPALLRAEYRSPDEDDALPFWENNHVLENNEQRMRISEFWGPNALGEYWDGDSYARYESAPSAESIENVIILFAGYAQCNDINIVTGQPGCGQVDGYADGCGGGVNWLCDHEGKWELLYTSIAARIILNEASYSNLYNFRNTLLTLVNQHEYDMALCGGDWVGSDEDAYAQMRNAWIDYIWNRTDRLRNVRTIILAGQSRGGVLAAALADAIKAHLLARDFEYDPSHSIRIVVATNAAANTEADEGLGDYTNWSLGGSGWGDNAHCHDLASIWSESSPEGAPDIYPLYWKQLVDDGIVDKPFIHTGDSEAGEGRPEFHDERIGSLNGDPDAIQNFYTQVFTNMGHTLIRVEYRTENGPDQLRFIYEKAWSTDTDRILFFDFEMVSRYGFEEFTCE